ncbi:MAG: diversity-generating retroelement protein Avd [Spirochaetota bacterium]
MKEFILYQKVYDFMLYLFPLVDRFPKHEKFALQTQIKNSIYNLLRLTIEIQKSKNKMKLLYDFDKELEFLKTLIMFANDKKPACLSTKSRQTSMEKCIEIGKIVGGLLKTFS